MTIVDYRNRSFECPETKSEVTSAEHLIEETDNHGVTTLHLWMADDCSGKYLCHKFKSDGCPLSPESLNL